MKHTAPGRPGWIFYLLLITAVYSPAQTLSQLYERLDLTLALPPSSRDLDAGGNPKVDSTLQTLAAGAPSRSLGALQSAAGELGVPIWGGRISVVATATNAASVVALQKSIVDRGGEVVTVVDRSILARVPASAIQALGTDPALAYLAPDDVAVLPTLPATVSASNRGLMSDGLAATKVNLLHARGIKGANVKVGIIDFGFTGYRALQAKGVLPAPVAVRAFGEDGGWDRGNRGTVHGTACAEIIHAMAPEAAIYIASIGDGSGRSSWDQIAAAARWLAAQGVDIISYSGGSHGGAHNGRDIKDSLVAEITSRGILWIASAGNEGDDHWGTTTRLDANNFVLTGSKRFLLVRAYSSEIRIETVWDDWGADPQVPRATQDYDIILNRVDVPGQRTSFATASAHTQNGSGRPYESFTFNKAERGALYALFIHADRATRPVKLHVFSDGAELYPRNSEGSIGIPAASPLTLAVGAVNVDTARLEVYSSQGPTDDGRAKPDVSAPDRVMSEAYGKEFTGTSAACPFASGFAALVVQMQGKVPPRRLAEIIINATTPLADNRGAGRGLIDASKLPAMTTSVAPAPSPAPSNPPAPPSPAPVTTASLADRLNPLLQLARPDNALGVRIVVGHSAYRAGDGLKLGYRAGRDAYCLVVRKNAAGQFTEIQPAGAAPLRLAADAPYVFPPEDGRTIRLASAGTEQMAILCSASPVSIDTIHQANPDSLSVSAVSYQIQ